MSIRNLGNVGRQVFVGSEISGLICRVKMSSRKHRLAPESICKETGSSDKCWRKTSKVSGGTGAARISPPMEDHLPPEIVGRRSYSPPNRPPEVHTKYTPNPKLSDAELPQKANSGVVGTGRYGQNPRF